MNTMTIREKVDDPKENFLATNVAQSTLIVNGGLALVYFIVLTFWFPKGNSVLYWLLIAGEVFHLWQLFTYLYTVWDTEYRAPFDSRFIKPVDVFITVTGEPLEVVEETVRAAKAMRYPDFKVHILNDGFVAKKENWRDVEMLAQKLSVNCITRTVPGGAKAGNINNALRQTQNPLVAVFDADHVPHRDFLEKTVGYFTDPMMGFVQSPQYYKNFSENDVTRGSWEQQALFFGPICKGKNRLNSVTMCGTNMLISRKALVEVGGMCDSIAEDFLTGFFMHEKGYKSTYIPEVLAEGLAPADFLSYYKQQFRWARGALDMVFKYNILFRKGVTLAQKIQYLSSISFFFSGLVVLMNALIPIVFLFTGLVPFQISTMVLAAIFLPYIFLTLYVLRQSSNFTFTFKSLAFSMAGFMIHIQALWAALLGKKTTFHVTSKQQIHGNFINLVYPHIAYIALLAVGMIVGAAREGLTPSVVTNSAWAILNVSIFMEFIRAAVPQEEFAGSIAVQKHSEHAQVAN